MTTQPSNSEGIQVEGPRVFLCHASADKSRVRKLYGKLVDDGFRPWLDEENLRPGEDWELAIREAMRAVDYVVVCLSNAATTRAGFVQKEIKQALDVADEQPEGSIYVIPVRLEDCVVPKRLHHLHWVNLFAPDGYLRLTHTLNAKAASPRAHPELGGVSEQEFQPTPDRTAAQEPARTTVAESRPQAGKSKRARVGAVIAVGVAVVVGGGLVAMTLRGDEAAKKCGSRQGDPARGIYCVVNPCESYPDTCTLPVYSSPGGSAVVDRLEDDEQIHIVCQVRGARFQGHDRATYVWDRLEDGHYISDYFASTKAGAFDSRLPRC